MKTLAFVVVAIALIVLTQWLIAQFFLAGPESPERWLHIGDDVFVSKNPESAEHRRIAEEIYEGNKQAPPPGVDSIRLMRSTMDTSGQSVSPQSKVLAFESAELTGDWLIPPAAVPGRRLLYLHGGGFTAGSALSHRSIADRLAIRLSAEVFLPNYRLMPEHRRADGIHDCRTAYRWILDHGHASESPVQELLVAGDSAGGNLALAVVIWARDNDIEPADKLILFSPHTDTTMSAPSHSQNLDTDLMQGAFLRQAMEAPRSLFLWMNYFFNRIIPNSPEVSPLFGDLSDLPPTLIQASKAEVLLDDAVRLANKAREQGTVVELQLWPHTLHAWQVFDTPESTEALENVVRFVEAFPPGISRSHPE